MAALSCVRNDGAEDGLQPSRSVGRGAMANAASRVRAVLFRRRGRCWSLWTSRSHVGCESQRRLKSVSPHSSEDGSILRYNRLWVCGHQNKIGGCIWTSVRRMKQTPEGPPEDT